MCIKCYRIYVNYGNVKEFNHSHTKGKLFSPCYIEISSLHASDHIIDAHVKIECNIPTHTLNGKNYVNKLVQLCTIAG